MTKEQSSEAADWQSQSDETMTKECIEEKFQAINEVAAKQLLMLLADLVDNTKEDKEVLGQYEVDFLGDLYARMVIASYMGYCPDMMGADAIEATERLVKLSKEKENE